MREKHFLMGLKRLNLLIGVLMLLIHLGCKENETGFDKKFPELEGAYLGQIPPKGTPELFAPGIVCTGMDDRDIAISPDGKEIFYGVLEKPHYVLIRLKEEEGKWQPQTIAPFSGMYNDYEPQFSPDGNRLYFCSDRPLDGTGNPKDADIWFVEKQSDGWSAPKNLGAPVNSDKNEFYPSITKSGTLYFTSHDMKICRSRCVNGEYHEPEILPEPVNTSAEYNAFVHPDEKYIIYTSHSWGSRAARGDLFISFRTEDDIWSKPVNLGSEINSSAVEMSPTLSLDGQYLFFSSNRTSDAYSPIPTSSYGQLLDNFNQPENKKLDIYWVDADVINSLEGENPGI